MESPVKLGRVLILLGFGLAASFVVALAWDPEGLATNLEAMAAVRADDRREAALRRQREDARRRLAEEEERRRRATADMEARIREQTLKANEVEIARQAELRRLPELVHPVPPEEYPLSEWSLPHRRPVVKQAPHR